MSQKKDLLSEVERKLKEKYGEEEREVSAVPSTAQRAQATRVDQLLLPDSERAKMPLTKDKYIVRENQQLVTWERETRKFLRLLPPGHEHRVAAVMIYEWATGLPITEHIRLEREGVSTPGQTTWRADIRKINKILEGYFGKPYMTWIAGRKVPKAYRVPQGYHIFRHRPQSVELWMEWKSGVKL